MCWITWFFLLVLPVLWFTSHTFRYYMKFALYTLWLMITASIFIPIFLFRPGNVQNVWLTSQFLRRTFWMFGIRIETRNLSMLSYDKSCVLVCNHQSILDAIAMNHILPPRTTILAKKELLYAGPFGIASWLGGIIFVDRTNREKAHLTVEKTARIMHSRNANVWIFPEGTRSGEEGLLPFKKGAFHLAIQAQVPIFPIVFSSYRDFLSRERKIFNRGKMIITCMPPVETTGLKPDDVNGLVDRVRSAMETVYRETSAEIHEEARRNGTSILTDAESDDMTIRPGQPPAQGVEANTGPRLGTSGGGKMNVKSDDILPESNGHVLETRDGQRSSTDIINTASSQQ